MSIVKCQDCEKDIDLDQEEAYENKGKYLCDNCGDKSLESFEELYDEVIFVAKGMKTYGGSFMKAIGEALTHADCQNQRKIKMLWPEEWAKYLEWGKK